jgi:uncharacterized protein YggE
VLDKAVAAGADSIYSVGFGHNDPSALWDKARPLAVDNARRKADIQAPESAKLMVLTEEPGRPPIVSFPRACAAPAFAPTPIEAGEDKLTLILRTRFQHTQ